MALPSVCFVVSLALLLITSSANHPTICSNKTITAWYDGTSLDIDNNTWIDKSSMDNDGIIYQNTSYKYNDATDIILSGCSAGGLAVYIHSVSFYNNYVGILKNKPRFMVIADGGYFLETQGPHSFISGMQWLYDGKMYQ